MALSIRGLPRSEAVLARAERMLADLSRCQGSTEGFRDRLPYVLDLLAGVSRTIDQESHGQRTYVFSSWWSSVLLPLRGEITELRHAELKRFESRTAEKINTVVNASAADYPGLRVADGDTVTTVHWQFLGGPLDGQAVLPVLERYLRALIAPP